VIQYAPAGEQVREIPLVMIPPQINKYYITDLAPGRSIVEFLVAGGVPTFMVSWRNPTREMRQWGLDTYVAAARDALAVAAEVAGSEEVNVSGFCAGGLTTALLLGHLAAEGDRRVRSAMFGVTLLDMTAPSIVGIFVSPSTVAAAKRRSARAGVLEGRDMARIFAWLRPNDLVWNYFVNNYLLGNDPPAFDILYWNDDTTRLPGRLHGDFLDLALTPLEAGSLEVLGTAIDLSKVDCDTYVLAGMTDHIVPWEGAFATTRILGGETEFVLGSSGHIQSLVNPPTNPKAKFFTGGDLAGSAQDWLRSATETKGSWWPHWLAWLDARSGDRRPAPAELGSNAHPPLDPAPGRYVKER
jgi:polyhydroxyalkanoate synthase